MHDRQRLFATLADLIHPNDAGHAIIADRIEPAWRAALEAWIP